MKVIVFHYKSTHNFWTVLCSWKSITSMWLCVGYRWCCSRRSCLCWTRSWSSGNRKRRCWELVWSSTGRACWMFSDKEKRMPNSYTSAFRFLHAQNISAVLKYLGWIFMNGLDMCRNSAWMSSLWPCRKESWTLSCPRGKPDWGSVRKISSKKKKPCRAFVQPSKNTQQVCYNIEFDMSWHQFNIIWRSQTVVWVADERWKGSVFGNLFSGQLTEQSLSFESQSSADIKIWNSQKLTTPSKSPKRGA